MLNALEKSKNITLISFLAHLSKHGPSGEQYALI